MPGKPQAGPPWLCGLSHCLEERAAISFKALSLNAKAFVHLVWFVLFCFISDVPTSLGGHTNQSFMLTNLGQGWTLSLGLAL